MAKKRKSTRKKKAQKAQHSEPSVFWPLAGAILLIVIALFLLLGGFGAGGPLPTGMFNGVYWALGWTAYLAPFALGYIGVHKFMSESRKVPLAKLWSMIGFVVFSAAFAHVAFVSKTTRGAYEGGNGGSIGELLGGTVLVALDKIPASILFFVLALLMFFLSFAISPKVIIKPFTMLKSRSGDSDTDIQELKSKATGGGFVLKSSVPLEDEDETMSKPRHSTLKNTVQTLTIKENHDALTLASDPDWEFPGINLLNQNQEKADAGDVKGKALTIRETFANFNIDVEMEGANVGPRVTQYTLRPPTGVRLTKLTALENNLALDLAATSIRMEAPIPGERAVGIEVPNPKAAMVRVSSILKTQDWHKKMSALSIVVGRSISGKPVIGDLDKMPHLLIAGQTGSGKSVMVNTILTSLLYSNSPSDLKLILVDPKQVEMKPYSGLAHLLTPVIVEPEKCISALKWAVAEMERRYKALSDADCRDIGTFNAKHEGQRMPYIVIVIDELADLMMMAARDVEALIVRIAQKARAVGIHLVLATQRPSVNVITGLIKANVPARIAFTTVNQVDSRTIIDQSGAEKLLGQGDMLFYTAEMPKPIRVQGAFIGDDETRKVTDFIKAQRPPQYDDEVVSQPVQLNGKGGVVVEHDDREEPVYRDAVRAVIDARKASTSLLQRRLRIGYGKASRLIDQMEEQGIIGPADGSRPRDVLVSSVDEAFGGGLAADDDFDDTEQNRPSRPLIQ